jgi:hypothetical protein
MEKTLAILSLILAKRQKENTKRVRLKIMNTQSQKLNSKNNNLVARYTLQIVTSRSRCIKFTECRILYVSLCSKKTQRVFGYRH